MNESNALTVDAYLNPERWLQMEKLATSLVQSRAFPKSIQNAAQALVVMQAGVEMGLKPLEAINGLAIINGVVSPWGKTTVRLLKNHGWKIKYQMLNERGGGCRATISKDDETYTDELYFDQAVKSKWTEMKLQNGSYALKPGWYEGANREMKLRYGVLSKIIKTYVPEVMGSAGDIAEIAEDYVIVEEPASDINVTHKTTEVMTSTPDERKAGLQEFLEKNKNNPKAQPKPAKTEKKAQKNVENTSNSEQKEAESNESTPDQAEAIEGEIVTDESKE